jgi:S-disulfanyl-L-cysteine oxidoreductase SoxD
MAEAVITRLRRPSPIALLALLTFALAAVVVEQSAAQAKPSVAKPKTTLNGVYTAAQAQRGEETYYNTCVNCHPKGTYAGPSFKTNWAGRPLSDLFDWVLTKMPKNDPGTLTPAESVQVVAYILQENKMPAGKTALPANPSVLDAIRIEIR